MHGHHNDAVLVPVLAVQVGVQGDFVQKTRQRGSFPRIFQIAMNRREQLPDVLQTGLVLHGVLALQHHRVACAGQKLLVKLVQRHGLHQLRQLPNEPRKLGQLGGGTLQLRVEPGVVNDRKQRDLVPQSNLLGGLHGLGADAAGRVVDDALKP